MLDIALLFLMIIGIPAMYVGLFLAPSWTAAPGGGRVERVALFLGKSFLALLGGCSGCLYIGAMMSSAVAYALLAATVFYVPIFFFADVLRYDAGRLRMVRRALFPAFIGVAVLFSVYQAFQARLAVSVGEYDERGRGSYVSETIPDPVPLPEPASLRLRDNPAPDPGLHLPRRTDGRSR